MVSHEIAVPPDQGMFRADLLDGQKTGIRIVPVRNHKKTASPGKSEYREKHAGGKYPKLFTQRSKHPGCRHYTGKRDQKRRKQPLPAGNESGRQMFNSLNHLFIPRFKAKVW